MRSAPIRPSAGVPAPWPQRWLARHRRGMDLLVVGLVLAYNQLVLPLAAFSSRSDFWVLQAASACLCLAYPLRRRHPLAVFGVMILAACVQLLINAALLPADLMLLLIVHHLAATSRWTTSLPAAAAVVAWVPLVCAPMIRSGEARLSLPGLLIVAVAWAWTWGVLARTRQNYVAALAESAERSLREQEACHRADALDERARIAREIHDIVSHSLGVMVVVADGAATTAPADPQRAADAMIRVRDTGREAMGEMRRMLSLLRTGDPTGVEPQPGIARLEDLVAEARSTGLPVSLSVTGRATGPLDPPAGLGLTVYRLVQEALTNARRHGGSVSRVDVRVHHAQDRLEVEVLDDGDGLSASAGSSGSPGHGLVGMRERVASHGGALETGPRADGGFRVRAVLPIRNGEP